jgi:hypothetical protein
MTKFIFINAKLVIICARENCAVNAIRKLLKINRENVMIVINYFLQLDMMELKEKDVWNVKMHIIINIYQNVQYVPKIIMHI